MYFTLTGVEKLFIIPRTSLYRGFTVYQRSVYVRKCVTNKCCLIIGCENCVLICLEMNYLLFVLWKRAAGRLLKLQFS